MPTDPAVVTALVASGAALISAAAGALFGHRGSKAQLADIEQRIAATLLEGVEKRLVGAEKRIADLEREVRELQAERNGLTQRVRDLETELAVVTAERDQLAVERDGLLDRISVLQPPPEKGQP